MGGGINVSSDFVIGTGTLELLEKNKKRKKKEVVASNVEFLRSCVRAKRLSSAQASVRLSNRIDRYLIARVSIDRFDRFTPRCRYRGSARGEEGGEGRRRRRRRRDRCIVERRSMH